jgi:hypothetical protein
MNPAKVNTAKTFLVGPVLDADGVAKTDEVVGSIRVTKNGVVGAPHASSTLTHNHTGHYLYAANAGDFDTLGEVQFSLNSGTNAMAPVSFTVVPANVFDSLVSGSDLLDVTTDAASRTASQATGFALASVWTAARAAALTDWLDGGRLDLLLDAITGYVDCLPTSWVTVPTATAIADAVLIRAVENVEDTADKHSLGGVIMFATNFSISGATLTAKKPSDDSTFQTYALASDASADPITGAS